MKMRFNLLWIFCVTTFQTYAQKSQCTFHNLGDFAPKLRVKEWIKGTPVQDFKKDKFYVIEFCATWCRPCMASLPHLSILAHRYKKNIIIVAIDVYEQKTTATAKIKSIIDSLGKRVDFDVAIEDTNFTVHDWLESWGQKDEGIPRTFVVNTDGKVAWIGQPKDLPKVLPKILNNKWNIEEANQLSISQQKLNNYLDSLDIEAGKKLSKYEGNYYTKDDLGNPDSALLLINEIVNYEPKLKYAHLVTAFTFTTLLKTDPHKAWEYGKNAITAPNLEGPPPYHAIIDGIKDYEYKINIPSEIYKLGAEAYTSEIDQSPYPELFDDPEIYNTIANWYWLAGDKSKAVKARRKAKRIAKKNLNRK